jgi:transposase
MFSMPTRRYQKVLNRHQAMLLPSRVEDYVSENNPVRAIDAYVDTVDLADLGFKYASKVTSMRGQPPYNPAALLKLYLYGYIHRVHSSRRLEAETRRNLDVIWLLEALKPHYKTIANFRKENANALKSTNRDFILMCKDLNLLGGKDVAVDGTFLKGDASKQSIYTKANLDKQLKQLDKAISTYQETLSQQDKADDESGKGSLIEDEQIQEKIILLKQRQAEKQALLEKMKKSGEKQLSTVDKDARLLSKRGQSIAGYNAQIVVDGKNKLIVANDVVQDGNDMKQLSPMLEKAQDILKSDTLEAYGDTGYHTALQIKDCDDMNIIAYVAIPKQASPAKQQGRFSNQDFSYDKENNGYHCPQGNQLEPREKPIERDSKRLFVYRGKASFCKTCPQRKQCLSKRATTRKIECWEHQNVLDRHQQRMDGSSNSMKKRASLVEHPFGTLKHRAGMHHFLMRGLKKCKGEFSLMVMCYNFTRAINLLGVEFIRHYCAQRQGNEPKHA